MSKRLYKIFQQRAEDLKSLSDEIDTILSNKPKNKPSSKKLISPLTRLRKDTGEAEKVKKADKDIQYIRDKFNDILKGT